MSIFRGLATCFLVLLVNEVNGEVGLSKKKFSLVVLGGSFSHATGPLEYGKVLVERGHDVEMIHMEEDHDWTGVSSGIKRVPLIPYPPQVNETFVKEAFATLSAKGYPELRNVVALYFDGLYEEAYTALLNHWNQSKPDLIACDMWASACFDAADTIGVEYVTLFDTGLGIFGAGDNLDTPGYFFNYGKDMSLLERAKNMFLTTPLMILNFGTTNFEINAKRANVGVATRTVIPLDTWKKGQMVFCSHIGWEWASYQPPYVHLVGPVFRTGKDRPDLSGDVSGWLQSSAKGLSQTVVYVGLGSRASLTDHQFRDLLAGLTTCPDPRSAKGERLRVLWSGKDMHEEIKQQRPSEDAVFSARWLPQQAILDHKNVKVFLSHGGITSIQESLWSGVPLVVLPFFGDQFVNAQKLEDAGTAVALDKDSFTPASLCAAVQHALVDPEMARHTERVRTLSRLRGNGAERGADILEQAAYVGSFHLFPFRETTNVIQAHNLDLLAIVAFAVFAVRTLLSRNKSPVKPKMA